LIFNKQSVALQKVPLRARAPPCYATGIILCFGEDDRYLEVTLLVAAFYKCLYQNIKSVDTRGTTATRVGCVPRGWVGIRPLQGTAALLSTMTQDPAYCSWTPRGCPKQDQRYRAASL